MQAQIYDKNFISKEAVIENEIEWYDVSPRLFDIYGFLASDESILSRRLPSDIAEATSKGVLGHHAHAAGGRVRFSTDSPFIALKVVYESISVPTVCTAILCYGFDLNVLCDGGEEKFIAAFRPTAADAVVGTPVTYRKSVNAEGKTHCYTLNFPHFASVASLKIGLAVGSSLGRGMAYKNSSPIVFYGSSITHGAAAGKPGNTYENFISQKYNLDYVNLGFSGNARAEDVIVDYMAGIDMCMFVSDYDHNAPNVDHLNKTHFSMYEKIRAKNPTIPYIMISRPDFYPNIEDSKRRREVVRASYERAVALGDKNVYYIDGEHLFDGEFYESCTNDAVHPNDIGFLRMADKIGAVIVNALYGEVDL